MSPFGKTNKASQSGAFSDGGTVDKFHEKVAGWIKSAQKYTKFWVAVAGGVLAVVVGEVPLPDDYVRYAQVAIALATAFSVYQFPNAPTDSE